MCFVFQEKLKLHLNKIVANAHLHTGIVSEAEITLWKQYDSCLSHALNTTLVFLATISYFSQFSEVKQQLPETINSQDCKTVYIIQRLRHLAWLLPQTLKAGLGSVCSRGIGHPGRTKLLLAPPAAEHQQCSKVLPLQVTFLSLGNVVPLVPSFSATCFVFASWLLGRQAVVLCSSQVQQDQQQLAAALSRSVTVRVMHGYGWYHARQLSTHPCFPHVSKCPVLTDGLQ